MADTKRHFEKTLTPLLRLKNIENLRDGIFTPLEREEKTIQYKTPFLLLEKLGEKIEADLPRLQNQYRGTLIPPKVLNETQQVEGLAEKLFVHTSASLSRFAVFDTTKGTIVIDANVRISAFSLIQGPAYIGKDSQLDRCNFSNSICGENCRLGGEIADSIIGNFSNKHHEGFLGHSLVGDWVNLGALTTTSDLKNNYGEVRLHFGSEAFNTGTIKFGSIIGDYVKTAIGTMLGTGTVVDFGTNLFGAHSFSGYIPPFQWGKEQVYEREKFLTDAERMMQRRGKSIPGSLAHKIRAITGEP